MKKKILVKGPVLSRSGYGEQARFAVRALRSRPDLFDIYLVNIPWGKTGNITDNTEDRRWLDETLVKTQVAVHNGLQFDVSLQITIPPEFEPIAAVNIGYTAGIETTKAAPRWLVKCNEMTKIITISEHSKAVFEQTKYDMQNEQTGEVVNNYAIQVPVDIVNYPIRRYEPEALDLNLSTSKNFLAVAQWGPRKNLHNLIKWFVEEFHDDEDVGLILKTNLMGDSLIDREHTTGQLKTVLLKYKERKCKIYLVHGTLTEGHLTWLYQHPSINALVNIAHGEGYGLPLFEAAYNGLPLATITWGGQLDFICKPNKKNRDVPRVAKINYDIKDVQKEAVWPGVIEKGSKWAYARESSFKRTLREVLDKEVHYRKEAEILKNHIEEKFAPDKIYDQFVKSVYGKIETPQEEIDFINQVKEVVDLKDLKYIVKNKFLNYPSHSVKTELLKDLYAGKECCVLTCGPSLGDVNVEELREKLQDKVVIAVKQAYNLVPDLVDIHVFNCNNFETYDYSNNNPLVVGCSSLPEIPSRERLWGEDQQYDLFLQVISEGWPSALCNTLDFDSHALSHTLTRPWGPGIMSELVFYLVEHLGLKSVTTLGWDLEAPGDTTSRHYYEERELINKAAPLLPDEAEKNIAASKEWHQWLKSKGVELYVGTQDSYVHEDVPRKSL